MMTTRCSNTQFSSLLSFSPDFNYLTQFSIDKPISMPDIHRAFARSRNNATKPNIKLIALLSSYILGSTQYHIFLDGGDHRKQFAFASLGEAKTCLSEHGFIFPASLK